MCGSSLPLRMRATSGPAAHWWHFNCNVNNCTVRQHGALKTCSVKAAVSGGALLTMFAAWTASRNTTAQLSHILDAPRISISHVYIHASAASLFTLRSNLQRCWSVRKWTSVFFPADTNRKFCKQCNHFIYWTGQFEKFSDFNLLLVWLPSPINPSLSEVRCWWAAVFLRVYLSFFQEACMLFDFCCLESVRTGAEIQQCNKRLGCVYCRKMQCRWKKISNISVSSVTF